MERMQQLRLERDELESQARTTVAEMKVLKRHAQDLEQKVDATRPPGVIR